MEQGKDIKVQQLFLPAWRLKNVRNTPTGKFKKDYKLCKRRGYDMGLLEKSLIL